MKFSRLAIGAITAVAFFTAGAALSQENLESESEFITTFRFPAKDSEGNPLSRAEIEKAIDEAVIVASRFDRVVSGPADGAACVGSRRPNYVSGLNSGFTTGGKVGFGKTIPDIYQLQYDNYTHYAGARTRQGSSIGIIFEESYTLDGESVVVSFKPYEKAKDHLFVRVDPSCGPIAPLGTLDEVTNDAHNALKTADPVVIRRKIIEGEIDTPYPAESVAASFDRLWSPLQENTFQYQEFIPQLSTMKQRGTLYLFEHKKLEHPIFISVYPYRDGSKVSYEVAYGYGLTSDGGSNFDNGDISALEQAIADVALD